MISQRDILSRSYKFPSFEWIDFHTRASERRARPNVNLLNYAADAMCHAKWYVTAIAFYVKCARLLRSILLSVNGLRRVVGRGASVKQLPTATPSCKYHFSNVPELFFRDVD